MKVLKIIIGIVVVLVGAVFIWLAMLPNYYRVERTIVINANTELIMENISNFKNWNAWSPWAKKDPDMKITFAGNDGEVGSSMSWDGNDSVGMGSMTIASIEDKKSITYNLKFIKPWESSSVGVFKFSENDGGVKVAWVDEGDLPFFMRWMGNAMDAWIGPDFEKGLASLKTVVEEKSANVTPAFQIEEMLVESFPYLSMTDSCAVEEIGATLGKLYGAVMGFCGANNITPAGKPFAIYHSWDYVATRITAGIPLSESAEGNDEIESGDSYAGNVLKLIYVGSYEESGRAHEAIEAYSTENGKEIIGAPWEVYVSGPDSEPDPNNYITEIYYPVK